QDLPFKEFEFHGFLGKRRIVSYGWSYDYGARQVRRTAAMPDFLLPARAAAARFAGLDAASFQQALVTEYTPGAAIGWHKDKPQFGEVIGLSLLSPCQLRFRPQTAPTSNPPRPPTNRPGGARASPSSRAPPICCRAPRAATGSTASPASSGCATRSRSAISGTRERRHYCERALTGGLLVVLNCLNLPAAPRVRAGVEQVDAERNERPVGHPSREVVIASEPRRRTGIRGVARGYSPDHRPSAARAADSLAIAVSGRE